MSASSSRSQGSRSHPCAHFIRFTEEENKELKKLVDKRDLSVQAFGHAAIMRAIHEAQSGKETALEIEQRLAERRAEEKAPQGLGIRDRLKEQEAASDARLERIRAEENEARRDYGTPAAPVYLSPIMSAPGAEIHTLARMIVGLPLSARRDALRAAIQSLAHGRTQEEALRLADQLDAEFKRLDGAPTTALERVRARMKR